MNSVSTPALDHFLAAFTVAVRPGAAAAAIEVTPGQPLPSAYAVTDFATAAIGTAAIEAAGLVADLGGGERTVVIDRDQSSMWFGLSLIPDGWQLPSVWDAVAGDYVTADGWIRLHTNAPHHRRAALGVLGVGGEDATRADVTRMVSTWSADELEAAVVAAGGCAAAMRTPAEWAEHPQGRAVAAEPLLRWTLGETAHALPARVAAASPDRPLAGVRVLDLTRVLAGPVATRFLAGLGADVLRIDPPDWDEAAVVPEVTLGKRCGRLDLRTDSGRTALTALLAEADIVVHGYRPAALEGLGFGSDVHSRVSPGIVDVHLDAYGWTGPWSGRRGFDSLVQMSCGIAATGMAEQGTDRPLPLPVQALDHATGYLLAAAALRGWRDRRTTGLGARSNASLARTAALLMSGPAGTLNTSGPLLDHAHRTVEHTPWGPANRLTFAATIDGAPLRWDRPASRLGSEPPPLRWLAR